MVEQSKRRKEFSELGGKEFEVYLGTITYEVSLASYKQFILTAGDSNEIGNFLRGVSDLQLRLDALKAEYEGQLVKVKLSDQAYKVLPEELIASAQKYFERLAIKISDFQVTELEFVEGSVKGRVRVVLKGSFEFLPVAAAIVTIAGVDFSSLVQKEKDRIFTQSCVSFGDVHNDGGGDININVNINPFPPKPNDMQTYFSEPERVEKELLKAAMKELNIVRPKARPEPTRPVARPEPTRPVARP
tara:strand:+ start:7693 stop:8427 length:735 start_codon:yes stop_codon:yes gene_type:complete